MNIAKHMETIFLATLVLIGATTMATAAVGKLHRVSPVATPAAVTVAVANPEAPMAVVKITAKRLTAAEKAAL